MEYLTISIPATASAIPPAQIGSFRPNISSKPNFPRSGSRSRGSAGSSIRSRCSGDSRTYNSWRSRNVAGATVRRDFLGLWRISRRFPRHRICCRLEVETGQLQTVEPLLKPVQATPQVGDRSNQENRDQTGHAAFPLTSQLAQK